MENVEMTREKNILTITVDLSKPGKLSASGKTTLIASSQGNALIPEEKTDKGKMFLGLNVFVKK